MTENLPVQRYFLNVRHTRNVMLPVVNERFAERKGDWVLYADHLAAIRACEQRVREDQTGRCVAAFHDRISDSDLDDLLSDDEKDIVAQSIRSARQRQ